MTQFTATVPRTHLSATPETILAAFVKYLMSFVVVQSIASFINQNFINQKMATRRSEEHHHTLDDRQDHHGLGSATVDRMIARQDFQPRFTVCDQQHFGADADDFLMIDGRAEVLFEQLHHGALGTTGEFTVHPSKEARLYQALCELAASMENGGGHPVQACGTVDNDAAATQGQGVSIYMARSWSEDDGSVDDIIAMAKLGGRDIRTLGKAEVQHTALLDSRIALDKRQFDLTARVATLHQMASDMDVQRAGGGGIEPGFEEDAGSRVYLLDTDRHDQHRLIV